MTLPPNCAKCSTKMMEGFIADYNYGESNITAIQSVWVEGEFKTNWLGSKYQRQ